MRDGSYSDDNESKYESKHMDAGREVISTTMPNDRGGLGKSNSHSMSLADMSSERNYSPDQREQTNRNRR